MARTMKNITTQYLTSSFQSHCNSCTTFVNYQSCDNLHLQITSDGGVEHVLFIPIPDMFPPPPLAAFCQPGRGGKEAYAVCSTICQVLFLDIYGKTLFRDCACRREKNALKFI